MSSFRGQFDSRLTRDAKLTAKAVLGAADYSMGAGDDNENTMTTGILTEPFSGDTRAATKAGCDILHHEERIQKANYLCDLCATMVEIARKLRSN